MSKTATLIRDFHFFGIAVIHGIEGNAYILGRGPASPGPQNSASLDNNFIPCPSSYVSEKHAKIFFKHGTFRIRDLKSTTGTYLNGEKLDVYERELRFGDRIWIGWTNLDNFEAIDCFAFTFQSYTIPSVPSYPVPVQIPQPFQRKGGVPRPYPVTEIGRSSSNVEIIDEKPSIARLGVVPPQNNVSGKKQTNQEKLNPATRSTSISTPVQSFADSDSDSDETVRLPKRRKRPSQGQGQNQGQRQCPQQTQLVSNKRDASGKKPFRKPGPLSYHRKSEQIEIRKQNEKTSSKTVNTVPNNEGESNHHQHNSVLSEIPATGQSQGQVQPLPTPTSEVILVMSSSEVELDDALSDSNLSAISTTARLGIRSKRKTLTSENNFKRKTNSSNSQNGGLAETSKKSKSKSPEKKISSTSRNKVKETPSDQTKRKAVISRLNTFQRVEETQDGPKIKIVLTRDVNNGKIAEQLIELLSSTNRNKILKQFEVSKNRKRRTKRGYSRIVCNDSSSESDHAVAAPKKRSRRRINSPSESEQDAGNNSETNGARETDIPSTNRIENESSPSRIYGNCEASTSAGSVTIQPPPEKEERGAVLRNKSRKIVPTNRLYAPLPATIGPRKLKVISRPPTPPHVRRQRSRAKPSTQSPNCSQTNPGNKETIKEHLKRVAMAEKARGTAVAGVESRKPKPSATVVAKVTRRNRSDRLLETVQELN